MERQFLNEYYQLERKHWWFQVREQIIVEQLERMYSSTHTLKILNVGAATGRSSEILQPFGTVDSLEYDYPSFEFCRDVLKMNIKHGSILELPYENEEFDLVCAFDVVEHVDDDKSAVKELFRVCKPGGHILVTVPAFMSLWSTHDIVNQHFRRYTKQSILSLFSQNEGVKIRSTYFNFLMFLPVWMIRRLQFLIGGKKRTADLKPDNSWTGGSILSRLLYFIFDIDRFLLKKIDLPIGVSFMLVWKKPA